MRITLFAFGSRGDVQPHIALGAGLRDAGHSVRIVTHGLFEPLVTRLGLDFSALEVNPQSVVENERGQDWLGSGANFLQFFQRFSRIAEPVIQQTMRDCWQACHGTDLIVFSPLGIGIVSSIAEKLGVPYWIGAGQPLTPTGDCAIPFFPQFPQAPGWLAFERSTYHRSTYLWSARLYWRLLLPSINKARRNVLNLPPLHARWLYEEMKQQRIPILYYFSPSVLPRPALAASRGTGEIFGSWPSTSLCRFWQHAYAQIGHAERDCYQCPGENETARHPGDRLERHKHG